MLFESPKISIVIPVYNVEPYLRQCLDSVVNQTIRDIQIICVNDGSPDGSRDILQEYADKDSRITIIDKPNGGISSARNAAYPHIKGKYTLFVDSDDWIKLDLCEKTYQKAETTGASMTVFFSQRCKGKKIRLIVPGNKTTIEEKLPILDFPCAWSKLWRTDFLLDNKLYFPEGLFFEDALVHWQAVTLAEKIAVVPERLYYYRRNYSSITKTRGEHTLHVIPIYEKIREYLLESGCYAAYRNKFLSRKLNIWFHYYRNLPASMRQKFIAMIREVFNDDDREFCRSASKQFKSKIVQLFYAMIDGDKSDAWNFRVAYTMKQLVRVPYQLFHRWVVQSIRRWRTVSRR